MTSNTEHYLLFSEASCRQGSAQAWRFVLQNVETQRRFSATDNEPTDCGERLELLAVVRGLEALDGPARVTLVTKSRYVSRGIRSGLAEWRANGWRWERFGRIVHVRDHDLWQRIDRALLFHDVDCQSWQFEETPEEDRELAESQPQPAATPKASGHRPALRKNNLAGRQSQRSLKRRNNRTAQHAGGLLDRVAAGVRAAWQWEGAAHPSGSTA